jgi:uncharacterized protein
MSDWPLILLGGLLGSSHCVGMCGALAISVGLPARSIGAGLFRQVVYSAGRIFTYTFAGIIAGGVAGRWKGASLGTLHVQSLLAIAGGTLLVVQALHTLGLFSRWRIGMRKGNACLTGGLLATFLQSRNSWDALLAGMLTGFLPCGLVYAYVALSASTGSALEGALTMALFGAGTVPLMVLTGSSASLITLAARRRVLRLAACCVLITGGMTLHRGISGAIASWNEVPASCPHCELQ